MTTKVGPKESKLREQREVRVAERRPKSKAKLKAKAIGKLQSVKASRRP